MSIINIEKIELTEIYATKHILNQMLFVANTFNISCQHILEFQM